MIKYLSCNAGKKKKKSNPSMKHEVEGVLNLVSLKSKELCKIFLCYFELNSIANTLLRLMISTIHILCKIF